MSDKKFCPYCKSPVNSASNCPKCRALYRKSCAARMVEAGVYKCCGHSLHSEHNSSGSDNQSSSSVDSRVSTSTSTSSSGNVARKKSSSRVPSDAQAPGARRFSARQNLPAGRLTKTTTTTAVMPPSPPYEDATSQSHSPRAATSNTTTATLSVRAQSADSIVHDSSAACSTPAVTGISLQRLSGIITAQLERNNQSIINCIDLLEAKLELLLNSRIDLRSRIGLHQSSKCSLMLTSIWIIWLLNHKSLFTVWVMSLFTDCPKVV